MSWQRAATLLNSGEYKQAAKLLNEQKEEIRQLGDPMLLATVEALSQLCLTCQDVRQERVFHQATLLAAEQRERELLSRMSSLVALLNDETDLAIDIVPDLEPADRLSKQGADRQTGLLQRFTRLVSNKLTSLADNPEQAGSAGPSKETPSTGHQSASKIRASKPTASIRWPFNVSADRQNPEASSRADAVAEPASEDRSRPPAPDVLARSAAAASLEDGDAKSAQEPEARQLKDNQAAPSASDHLSAVTVTEDEAAPGRAASSPEGNEAAAALAPQIIPDPLLKPQAEQPSKADVSGSEESVSPALLIYCLGQFQVYLDDQLLEEWPSGRGKLIFKYLITHREQAVSKEVLMDLFWPDADPDAARNNLNVAIYGLREAFRQVDSEFSYILYRNGAYLLNPELRVWVDVEAFLAQIELAERLYRAGEMEEAIRQYQVAETFYQGEFLAADRYEEWVLPRRRQLRRRYLEILEHLSQYYYDCEQYSTCIKLCRAMLEADPLLEDAHYRLMCCHDNQGHKHLALRQYHRCAKLLSAELNLTPSPATEALYQKIRNQEKN